MKPLILIVLDGWGIGEDSEDNAQQKARIPFYRSLINEYSHTALECSGESVGLPEGQMGNSEVGHLNLGAGRVVYQDSAGQQWYRLDIRQLLQQNDFIHIGV